MSFIRRSEDPEWEDEIERSYYAYDASNFLSGIPDRHRAFIEVVMRMLDQTDELEEETLEAVHGALRSRLNVEEGAMGRSE